MAEMGFNSEDPKQMAHFRAMFGPGHIDQIIRQAIQMCWMTLPPKRQNAKEVEKEIKRLVDRALKDLKEDSKRFGRSGK